MAGEGPVHERLAPVELPGFIKLGEKGPPQFKLDVSAFPLVQPPPSKHHAGRDAVFAGYDGDVLPRLVRFLEQR